MAKFLVLFTIFCASSTYALSTGRIVGGQEAQPDECPYHVSIRSGEIHICSGAIVDNRTVITAASCLHGMIPEYLKIVLGTNDLDGDGKIHKVTSISEHTLYDPITRQYNVASMKLEPLIDFNKFVQPIEIAHDEVQEGQQIKASGWALMNTPGGPPTYLQTLKMKAINVQECSAFFEGITVDAKVVCGLPIEGKGMCYGDFGSPVVNTQKQLVGILSWGVSCALYKPEIFTSAHFFKEWIEEHKDH